MKKKEAELSNNVKTEALIGQKQLSNEEKIKIISGHRQIFIFTRNRVKDKKIASGAK